MCIRDRADPAAVVIAGGTDVLIKIREGKLAGCPLVSIHELGEELSGVTLADNGDVEIGPLTTFRGVTFSDVIRRTIPVLGEAADMAGGPQLRAAGTIGGNVCNGITSADTASTLVALDAVLRAVSYTHLDVYKRQHLCSAPRVRSEISPRRRRTGRPAPRRQRQNR